MKNKIRKVLSALMAVAMIASFSACKDADSTADGETKTSQSQKASTPEENAKSVAEEFLSFTSEFKYKDASELLDDPKAFDELADVNGMSDLINVAMSEVDIDAAELKEYGVDETYLKDIFSKAFGMCSIEYKITNTKENDDKTITIDFDVNTSAPDFDAFGEDIMTKYSTEINEYMQSLDLASATTAEQQSELIGKIVKYGFELALKDIEKEPITHNEKGSLILKEDSGKWVISSEKSDFDALAAIFDI